MPSKARKAPEAVVLFVRISAYQVKVQVVRLQVFQGSIEGGLDILWVMVCVPQLACDL
jgi:hypothetical protein